MAVVAVELGFFYLNLDLFLLSLPIQFVNLRAATAGEVAASQVGHIYIKNHIVWVAIPVAGSTDFMYLFSLFHLSKSENVMGLIILEK